MTRGLIVGLLTCSFGLGVMASASAEDWRHQRWCDWRDRNCDGRINQRDRYYSYPNYDYEGRFRHAPSYGVAGRCTFQTRRGPVAGYRPEGKDRCCVETRHGPSCQ
jgi:hypothetical protein